MDKQRERSVLEDSTFHTLLLSLRSWRRCGRDLKSPLWVSSFGISRGVMGDSLLKRGLTFTLSLQLLTP